MIDKPINGDKVTITVPLTEYMETIIKKTVNHTLPKAIIEFQKTCPTAQLHDRLVDNLKWNDKLKVRIAIGVGIAIGSGVLGGSAYVAVLKLLSG